MLLHEIAQKLVSSPTTSPRGLKTKEIRNFQFIVEEIYMTFEARKLNFDYMKAEALWYLSGNPFNKSILEQARIWYQIIQPDGRFFSNYGQYWFGEQNGFRWVVNQLIDDKDTRQAIIPMLNKHHCFPGNSDVVCTSCINFHIRDGKLHMTVVMRSSDFILGYAYDLPMFNMLHQMVLVEVNRHREPDNYYTLGEYCHMSMSLHVYEKHWDMLEKIARAEGKYEVDIPLITDAYDLLDGKFESDFGKWLKS